MCLNKIIKFVKKGLFGNKCLFACIVFSYDTVIIDMSIIVTILNYNQAVLIKPLYSIDIPKIVEIHKNY